MESEKVGGNDGLVEKVEKKKVGACSSADILGDSHKISSILSSPSLTQDQKDDIFLLKGEIPQQIQVQIVESSL